MTESSLFEPLPSPFCVTPDELRELYEGSGLVRDADGEALKAFAEECDVVHVPGGEKIIAMGQREGCAFTVLHGRLRKTRPGPDGSEVAVGDLNRGDNVGLLFLVTDEDVPFDVHSVRDSTLLRLSREAFERLADRFPRLMLAFSRAMAKIARRAIGGGGEDEVRPVVNVAVLRGADGIDLPEVLASIAAAAGTKRSTHLTKRVVSNSIGKCPVKETGREELTGWLHDYEVAHDLVLYECDDTLTGWTQVCFRQADRVLIAVPAGETPDAERIRTVLNRWDTGPVAPQVDVLVVHEPQAEWPSGTGAWLALGPVARHYHVRRGRTADFERVVRRLTGRGVGVVLGGGGARGIAHVGVLQAIDEAGIPIDFIAGVSMGSIFAAGWARGWTPDEMMKKVREVFAPKRALVDLTLPIVALVVGGKLERVLRSLFDGIEIEDLWTPFFCASTNLSRPGVIVHQRGPLWSAIRASVSLPGIFPPVRSGDDLLVDGGVLNNLPIDITSDLCDHGPVIAVDVSDANMMGIDTRYEHKASGWRMLGRKLNPFTDRLRVPSVFDVIMQSAVVASRQTQQRIASRAALFLKPPVDDFATMDFGSYEELRRVGYEYAKQRLAEGSLAEAVVARTG